MTHFDSGHHGHFERSFPKLTPGVKILLAINVAMFLVKNIGFDLILDLPIATHIGLSLANVLDGFGLGLLRTVSYQFFHSVNPMHLLWNMLFLYFFGTMVEGERDGGFESSYLRKGRSGIIGVYLLSGIAGGFGFLLISAMNGKTGTPVIGASGAVYGIMVYAACMFPRRRINMIFVQPELRYFVGFAVFLGVYWQLFELKDLVETGTAHSAHLGGAIWGYFAYRLAKTGVNMPNPAGWVKRKRQAGAARSKRRSQETLDEILKKVKEKGMGALTPAERRFLEKVSKNSRK